MTCPVGEGVGVCGWYSRLADTSLGMVIYPVGEGV